MHMLNALHAQTFFLHVLTLFVFAGASEYLSSADKLLLHMYCILIANNSQEGYVLRKKW